MKFNKKALKRAFAFMAATTLAISTNCDVSMASYYTDDAFRNISSSSLSPVSSWDFDESGGSAEYTTNKGIILHDKSYIAPVSMSKAISPDEGEVLTAEVAFTLSSMTDGFSIAFKSGNEKVCEIITRQMELMLHSDCGEQKLGSYASSKEIGVKMVLDPIGNTVTAMINGVTFPAIEIENTAVDEIMLSTPEKFKVDATINAVKVYSGYSLNEKFIVAENNLPDNWKLISGEAEIVSQLSASMPDVYCTNLKDGSEIKTDFTGINADKVRYEFRFLADKNAVFAWQEKNSNAITINANSGTLSVNGTEKNTYNPNVWQHIDVEIDNSSGKANVLQNGKYIAKNISVSGKTISAFYVQASGSDVLIDDICAYADKRGEAMPLTPVKAQSDAMVGMIRCDIWHEGYHSGWDKILPYPENHPYLGFYDDGNSDVSDWETKWMIEHGVDFQLHCWFLPRNYEGGVIKNPTNSYALEDGYFNSKYSEMIDFMIMWENQNYPDLTEESFRNYIVPYWIEYYLTDERYLVINNKPVISIYNVDNFLSGIGGGDAAVAKENIDFLKDECRKLGYDGAYVICSSNGLSDLSDEKMMGFDACHAYTWRDYSGTSKTQIDYLARAAENAAGLPVLPTVSVGIDEEPWGRPAGQMLTPEEFSKVLSFANESEYFQNVADMGKIMMLDSWNEFGEGHYMMPSGIHGFGYMDAVRNVYTSENSAHTDETPTADEKKKLGRLFNQERIPAPKAEFKVPVGRKTYHTWNGEEISSWTKNSHISSIEYDGNVLKATASGSDPSLVSPVIGMNVDDILEIRLKVKRSCKDTIVQLFYTNDKNENFSEKKSFKISGVSKNNEWEIVSFDVSDSENFKGNLHRLRLDIINTAGSFELDYVELLGKNDVYGWSGESLTKWKKNKHISTLEYSDGVLKGVSKDIDPSIMIESGLEIDIDDVNYIAIKAKRFASDGTLYMYYTTEKGENFTQAKSIYINAGKSGEWENLLIPIWKNNDFCGTLYKLRFDIINSIGSFEVESIKLIRANPGDITQWILNGETINPSVALMRVNGELYAEFRGVGTVFNVNTANKPDGSEIKFVTTKDIFTFCGDGTLLKNGIYMDEYSPVAVAADSYAIPLKAVSDIFNYNLIDDKENGKAIMTKMQLFPYVTYDASADTDENGLWIYRNLVPDPECENIDAFWDSPYQNDVDSLFISDEEYHSGNTSLKKLFKSAYARMGFKVGMKENTDYHFSAWLKNASATDLTKEMVIAGEYTTYDENGKSLGKTQAVLTQQSSQMFALNTDWQYINTDVRISTFSKNSVTYPIGETYTISDPKIYVTKQVQGEKVVYMDDINFRRIPYFDVYTKKVSHADGCEIGNESVEFTFSHDIDPWTVTPDKILINGKSGEGLIETTISTDEATRETKLSITFVTPPTNNEEVAISLSALKDAWGRNVIGASETVVTGGKTYVTTEFIKNGNNLKAKITVNGKEDDCLLIVSAENEQKIEKVQTYEVSSENRTFEFETAMDAEWQNINMFVWKSGESAYPLCNKAIVTKTEIEGSTVTK